MCDVRGRLEDAATRDHGEQPAGKGHRRCAARDGADAYLQDHMPWPLAPRIARENGDDTTISGS